MSLVSSSQPRLVLVLLSTLICSAARADEGQDAGWRQLPLIEDGKLAASWTHIGWGGFAVDDGSLRAELDPRGMGLLVYTKERFGDCQIRVTYRCEHDKVNSGVFIRIDEGIVKRAAKESSPAERDADGRLTERSLPQMMKNSSEETGAWYAVHHGYEVQILNDADPAHRTGAIYSLATAEAVPASQPGTWSVMVITLKGDLVLVEVDGKQVTSFDSADKGVSAEREWYEPKREPQRPQSGYIGLQNHDPGDVIYFKDISVRPLASG